MVDYVEFNGTSYHKDTPQKVIEILDSNLNGYRQQRLRFYFGDALTGRDWKEEYDIYGYVGRSTGQVKIPLLIHNRSSTGGGALLDDCIVKITESKAPHRVLYQHPTYFRGDV